MIGRRIPMPVVSSPNSRRRLLCCDGKEHAILDKAVQLDPGKRGETAVLAEEDVIDARHEQRFPVPYPWEMDRVGQDCNADTDDRIQCSVEYKDVGVGVPNVIYGDAQEDDCGEIGRLRDFEHDSRVENNADEQGQDDVIDDRAVIFDLTASHPEGAKEDARSPEGSNQGAGDPVPANFQHIGRVGLDTLQRGDNGIERRSAAAAEKVYDQAYECRHDGAEDSLPRYGEAGLL